MVTGDLRRNRLIRYETSDCIRSKTCDGRRTCTHDVFIAVLEEGEGAIPDRQKALRGAWRKGRDAFLAGRPLWDNPYERRQVHRDRRGRTNPGWGAAFSRYWQAGWSWAEWEASDEFLLDALENLFPRWPRHYSPEPFWVRYRPVAS